MTESRSKNVSTWGEVRLELRFFGAPRVSLYGEPVRFRSRKVLALLAFLAIEGGVHRRERLIELLWPDSTATRGSATMRSTLSRLRESLGEAATVLETEGSGVRIALGDRDWVDVHRLAAVSEAAEPSLADVDGLVGGRFLEGFGVDGSADFDDWVARWAARCQGQATALFDRLSAEALGHGRLDAAAELGTAWQRAAPFDDGPIARLVEVDARRGARASALERFDRYSEVLAGELGATPTASLRDLVDRVRDGDLAYASPREAIRRHLEAGRQALEGDDSREAVAALDQAVMLLGALSPADSAELTLPVLETRARASELCGRFEAARDDYRRLVERSEDHHELTWRLRGLVGLAALHATPTALADYDQATEHAHAALDLSRLLGDREAEALSRARPRHPRHRGRPIGRGLADAAALVERSPLGSCRARRSGSGEASTW